MKYYIISGEASGDLHGANLIKAIQEKDPKAEFRAWGGDKIKATGATLVKHYKDLAFMGIVEVIKNIRTIFKNIDTCKKDIASYEPDALILIDYSGFNLRIADWSHTQQFPTLYYISPQIWAWRTHRVKKIKQFIDEMYVILPFEKAFYAKFDYEVKFVGHPLLDVVNEQDADQNFIQKHQLDGRPIIALLPGSRRQEIRRMLSTMLTIVDRFPDYQFIIAGAPSIAPGLYDQILRKHKTVGVKILFDSTYQLFQHARAAIVTSGTATLEAALFEVPQVVAYRGNNLSYFLVKWLVSKNIKYISLVNLIMDAPLIKELIQFEFTPNQLSVALANILTDSSQENLKKGYQELKAKLGHEGASRRTASAIIEKTNRQAFS